MYRSLLKLRSMLWAQLSKFGIKPWFLSDTFRLSLREQRLNKQNTQSPDFFGEVATLTAIAS